MAQYRQYERFLSRAQHDPHPTAGAHRLRAARLRRLSSGKHRRPSAAVAVTLALALALALTLFTSRLFSPKEIQTDTDETDAETSQSEYRSLTNRSARSKELKFGRGSGATGRDSRYWDRDDRRRDEDYREEDSQEKRDGLKKDRILEGKSSERGQLPVDKPEGKKRRGGLYNEGGRAELDLYKEEYEHSLKNAGQLEQLKGADEVNPDDEYDDGIDVQDDLEDTEHGDEAQCDDGCGDVNGKLSTGGVGGIEKDAILDTQEKGSIVFSRGTDGGGKSEHGHGRSGSAKVSGSEKKSGSKRKPKHHKFSSSSCEMKFLNSTAHLIEPVQNKKFARFDLQYTDVEDSPTGSENWEPRFAGHQTLQEREESFYARDLKINCGFIKGPSGSPSTGFDLAEDDVKFMSSCHIAVSSCIFGNSDRLRSPFKQKITRLSKKNVCFVMFLDESTLQTLLSEGQVMDNGGYVGLWKIIVVKNLPFSDMRRVGKIPKLLTHRLFPSARYSIWLDSKLRLQSDPYLILEYFLWRHGYEYAISNHYDRHCVWEEVMQNKKLNKYNHTIIDQQFEFYQSDGLKRFDPSDPNKLLPSYVPEGSFIVRAHTPMSNLFSCLWFNEVDRFTPRDQLSFAYTYLKLRRMNPEKTFRLNMFKDCERRSIAKLFHHRAEEKRDTPKLSIR